MQHKAGFVNIVGNPNVGKSTLMNQLVGDRISIATFKAQTTRHRIMGIVNTEEMQIVFSDTPGVLKPNYKLQESMLAFSESALADADVLLYVTDVVENPEKNVDFLEKVRKMTVPVLLLINKIDLTDQKGLVAVVEKWHKLLPEVRVEQFKEEEKIIRISAVIYVERDSQKGIIIGHKGFALKKVSTEARKALEKFFGKSIFLETFVKVDKDWRSSKRELDSFGYNPE